MAWTLSTALQDPDLTVIDRDDHFGSYTVRIGSIPTEVRIELRRALGREDTAYYRTHDMHSPAQAGPYHQSRPYWDDPAYALRQAVTSLTDYYRMGVQGGHKPSASWLKPTNSGIF